MSADRAIVGPYRLFPGCYDRVLYRPAQIAPLVINPMCTVGGPVDIEFDERVKGENYRCKECGERFKGLGKRPMCPSCQSEDVEKA